MKTHKEIRWSEVVRKAITDYIGKLEEKGSEITTKDLLEELGDDFRQNLSELSFEKAEKVQKDEGCRMEKSLFDTNRLIDAYRERETLDGYTTINIFFLLKKS